MSNAFLFNVKRFFASVSEYEVLDHAIADTQAALQRSERDRLTATLNSELNQARLEVLRRRQAELVHPRIDMVLEAAA